MIEWLRPLAVDDKSQRRWIATGALQTIGSSCVGRPQRSHSVASYRSHLARAPMKGSPLGTLRCYYSWPTWPAYSVLHVTREKLIIHRSSPSCRIQHSTTYSSCESLRFPLAHCGRAQLVVGTDALVSTRSPSPCIA